LERRIAMGKIFIFFSAWMVVRAFDLFFAFLKKGG
jgi:hypothetical protein